MSTNHLSKKCLVLHQNIQSIKNKLLEIEVLIKDLDEAPTVACFTEHWSTDEEKFSMQLEGYNLKATFCRKNMDHGGSCIFLRDGVDGMEIQELKQKSIEGVIECSSIVCKALKAIIICIYKPPKGHLETFFQSLTDILDTAQNNYKNYKVILCGDFNLDLLERGKTDIQTFLTLLQTYNLTQTITEPTRITKTSATLLDNIFINFENPHVGEVITTALSDHEAQILKIEFPEKNRSFQKGKQTESVLHCKTATF